MIKSSRAPGWLKFLLSLIVIYHMTYVVLMPNRNSWLTQKIQDYLLPYGNTLSIFAVWQMFAPDPAPAAYLEYDIYKDGEVIGTDSFPKDKKFYGSQESLMRHINASRFVLTSTEKISEIFIPWVCKENPQATDIRVRSIVYVTPSAEQVLNGTVMNNSTQTITNQLAFEACDRDELVE
jgi:hypothetical protein